MYTVHSHSLTHSHSLSLTLSLPLTLSLMHTYTEDHLLYLDPHTVHPTVTVTNPCHIPDQTYHCSHPDRIPLSELDPSIALGFFCKDEQDLDDLIRRLKSVRYYMYMYTDLCDLYDIVANCTHTHTHTHIHTYTHTQDVLCHGRRYKMFEMTDERPYYWGPFENHAELYSPGERKNFRTQFFADLSVSLSNSHAKMVALLYTRVFFLS